MPRLRKRCRLRSVESPTSAASALAKRSERAASSRLSCAAPGAPRLSGQCRRLPSGFRRTQPKYPRTEIAGRFHDPLQLLCALNASLAHRAEKRSLLSSGRRQAMRLRALTALQPVLNAAQQPIRRAQFPKLRIADVPFIVKLLECK